MSNRRQFVSTCATAGIVAASGCLFSDPTIIENKPTDTLDAPAVEWPQYGYNPGKTASRIDDLGSPGPVEKAWGAQREQRGTVYPTVVESTLYLPTIHESIVAIDFPTAEIRWRRSFEWVPRHIPSDGNYLFVSAPGPDVVALDRSSGDQVWRRPRPDRGSIGPTVTESGVLFGTSDGRILLFDRADGTVQVDVSVYEPSPNILAVADGTAFVRTNHHLHAIHLEAGAWEWSGGVTQDPQCVCSTNGEQVLTIADATVVAFSASTGERSWSRELDAELDHAPAVTENSIYTGKQKIVALDAATGALRWETPLSASIPANAQPVVTSDAVYVPTGAGIETFDPATGEQLWRYSTHSTVTSLAVLDNYIVANRFWNGVLVLKES